MNSARMPDGLKTVENPGAALPALKISDGTLEGMKWLAIVLMTLDHFNKYILHESSELLFELGRIAMPLFAFIMAYNLARPGALARNSYQRATKRLALFGVLAVPACIALGGLLMGWWPLNILFMLLTTVTALLLIEQGRNATAAFVVIAGGFMVEFWWPAIGFTVAAWAYCKRPSWFALLAAIGCCLALAPINNNFCALLALPIIFAASKLSLKLPRSKWYFFYSYYPAHLYAILIIRHMYS